MLHNSGILGGILDIKKKFRKSREFLSNLDFHPTF